MTKKMTNRAKAATASAAPKAVRLDARADVVAVMDAEASAANQPMRKCVRPAKAVDAAKVAVRAVRKVATNCVTAKPARHVANAPSGVSGPNALPVKAVAMAAAKTARKAKMKAAAMPALS